MNVKEYLKMADVFDCEVESDADLMFSDSLGNIADFSGYKTQCRYSAHAINSHDDLVEMNRDLLATLRNVLCDCEFEIRHGGQVCIDTYAVRRAIEMANGDAS